MKRREFLSTAAAAVAASPALNAAPPASRIIDTHTHFYDPTRPQGVPWPANNTPLYRTVLPQHWLALAEPHGCRETVIVEASAWLEDNQWLLDLAAKQTSIVGICGHIEPDDAQFEAHTRRFAANRLFRGVRWRADAYREAAGRDQVKKNAQLLADLGLQLDLNGSASALPVAAELAAAVPDLRIVIDHLGAPGDPRAIRPEWLPGITALARHPNVFMKVSALVEQVRDADGKAPADAAFYLPILEPLWQHFGPERLIYGSNWPVSDRGAPYSTVFQIVKNYFESKGADACERYFWKNSLTAYRWVERKS